MHDNGERDKPNIVADSRQDCPQQPRQQGSSGNKSCDPRQCGSRKTDIKTASGMRDSVVKIAGLSLVQKGERGGEEKWCEEHHWKQRPCKIVIIHDLFQLRIR